MMTRVSQLWDLIDTWGFREDIKDIVANNADDNVDDENNNNNNKLTLRAIQNGITIDIWNIG